jgi:hypothetical protein
VRRVGRVPLSAEEQTKRRPLPPAVLMDDTPEPPSRPRVARVLAAKPLRVRR